MFSGVRQLVSGYTHLLRSHTTAVSSIEALVAGITWLVPERFSGSEVPAELANSASGLLSVLNEHLLAPDGCPPEQLLLASIQQVRCPYMCAWTFLMRTLLMPVPPVGQSVKREFHRDLSQPLCTLCFTMLNVAHHAGGSPAGAHVHPPGSIWGPAIQVLSAAGAGKPQVRSCLRNAC